MKKVGKTTRPFRYDLNQIPYDYTVEVRNRFKRLDLIDRVPEELWMEVHDIVQETGIKNIPKKKKYRHLTEALKGNGGAQNQQCRSMEQDRKSRDKPTHLIYDKGGKKIQWRKDRIGKDEKERYIHLNAEFQRITRRDKKAFLSDQCKEIEENNRMGKTRDLFKKN